MFLTATYVPVTKPNTPTTMMRSDLDTHNAFSHLASLVRQNTIISRIGGKMMAKALLANAPIREINKSSFGMPMARPANRYNNKSHL